MSLTTRDIQVIKRIVDMNTEMMSKKMEKNFKMVSNQLLHKPYVMDMTYDELFSSIRNTKMTESEDIEIFRLE